MPLGDFAGRVPRVGILTPRASSTRLTTYLRNDSVPLNHKRILDLLVTLPVLIATLPLQALVAALVARNLGRPVLFRQERPGLHGRPFTMRKFRTMLPIDYSKGQVTDESRLTDFGKWLRSTSLDELPSLWNIILGDMSLVGPRPLLTHYLAQYTPEQARRHEVRPGLTGLAQVAGRNGLAWPERFDLDVRYVDTMSVPLDIIILLRTFAVVTRRDGISAKGHVTMEEFTSNARPPEVPK